MCIRRWVPICAVLLLAACSKDKDIDKPAALPVFNATIRVDKIWSDSVADKGAKPLRLGLGLAVEGNRVYAAGHRGEVAAFDLGTGHTLWRTRTKLALSGGPGVDAALVVVGSSAGDLVALGAADGAVRWKVRLNGEVLASPAVAGRVVAVRTVDGRLHGLSPKDGHELWMQEEQVPRLSLRGTARPVLTGDLVLSGFDNGKVAALNVNDGAIQWETTIAPAHGKTELERLDDIDAAVRVSGSDVYAVGFQGRVAMLALDTGQIWWAHDTSSYRGIGLDDSALYIATADGEVVAMRRRTGTELWRQKALLHRRLSAAVEMDDAVVTADYQGYVHWLDKATGAVVARASSGKVRISNPPVVVGNTVLVVNDAGKISAFRATPIAGARPTVTAPAESSGSAAPAGSSAPGAPSDAAVSGETAAPGSVVAPPESSAPSMSTGSGGTTAPAAGSGTPPEPAQSSAPPPDDHPSSVPAAPPTEPMQVSPPRTPSDPAGGPAPVPPSPPVPSNMPPAPLPSQQTPDPLPPQPQTQPQPPPT